MYFLLETFIFIAGFFPGSKQMPVSNQRADSKKKLVNTHAELRDNAKVASKSSTPEPTRKSPTVQVPSCTHSPFGRPKNSNHNDLLIENNTLNVSAQMQPDNIASDDATGDRDRKAGIKHAKLDASTQTGDVAVSEHSHQDNAAPETSAQTKSSDVADRDPHESPTSDSSIEEIEIEVDTRTHEERSAESSPSSNFASGPTLVNTPSGALSPSTSQREDVEEGSQSEEDLRRVTPSRPEMMASMSSALDQEADPATTHGLQGGEPKEPRNTYALPKAPESANSVIVQQTGSNLRDSEENLPVAEAPSMVHEHMLKHEKSTHQQTREELAQLDDWCAHLTHQNEALQTNGANADRENARLQRQLQGAEDEKVGLETELSHARLRNQGLTDSIDTYLSIIERLKQGAVNLNKDVTWYTQPGSMFYARLQEVEKSLNHPGRFFAEYQSLMREAAQYFSVPMPEEANADPFGEERLVETEDEDDETESDEEENDEEENSEEESSEEELSEEEDSKEEDSEEEDSEEEYSEEENGQNVVPCDHLQASEADRRQAEEDDTTSDKDETPRFSRPMRASATRRVLLSAFAATSGDRSRNPSSSFGECPAPQGQKSPPPAFSMDFSFSMPSTMAEGKCETNSVQEQNPVQEENQEKVQEPMQEPAHYVKTSNTSARKRHERGGIRRGQVHPDRGTNRAGFPARGTGDVPRDKNVGGTDAEVDPSPAATAFSIDFGFLQPSMKSQGTREDIAVPVFGAQKPKNPDIPPQSSLIESELSGTVPNVKQEQRPGHKQCNASALGSDAFYKSPASTPDDIVAFGQLNANPSCYSSTFSATHPPAEIKLPEETAKVEEKEIVTGTAGNGPIFGPEMLAKFSTPTINTSATFGELKFETAAFSLSSSNSFTPATKEDDLSPSLDTNRGSVPKATPEVQSNADAFPKPKVHREESSVEVSKTKDDRDHGQVKSSSSKSKPRVTGLSKPLLTHTVCRTDQQSERSRKAEEKEVLDERKADDANTLDADAVLAPLLVTQYDKLIQSINIETRLWDARKAKRKATGYEPDFLKPPTWPPFSPKGAEKGPLLWIPVGPTIRPFEHLRKHGESSKSQLLDGIKGNEHVAKVKGWINTIAPGDQDKSTAHKIGDKEPPLTVEGPYSLTNGLARLSLGSSSENNSTREGDPKVQLSGDWNVSGMGNYTSKDLEKGPIFGRFLDATTTTRRNDAETKYFGLATKESQPVPCRTERATADEIISAVQEGRKLDRVEPSAGRDDVAGQEHGGRDWVVAGSCQEARGDESRGTDSIAQSKGQDGASEHSLATNSATSSSGQHGISPQHPKTDTTPPSEDTSSSQTKETYKSPYCLKGAFSSEDSTPNKKYISPFSLRYRKG